MIHDPYGDLNRMLALPLAQWWRVSIMGQDINHYVQVPAISCMIKIVEGFPNPSKYGMWFEHIKC